MAGWTALFMAANGRDAAGIRPMILQELLSRKADHTILLKGHNVLQKAFEF
jgi:hypothetical protein